MDASPQYFSRAAYRATGVAGDYTLSASEMPRRYRGAFSLAKRGGIFDGDVVACAATLSPELEGNAIPLRSVR